jgi:rhamnose utilization protein RhaD (predicted bifunctional aldolase and dehydrogenase)
MSIKELVEISRFYGADPDFLLAGGGNTSLKDGSILYVKASGYKLASISKEGFVKLDMYALNKIWTKNYSSDADSREKEVLKDLMNSRVRGEDKRPSVESLLHAVLPQKYIVHTHPALVNGITCSRKSRRMTGRLFGSRCMWVPSVNPGYVLAKLIKDMLEKHKKKHGTDLEIGT